MNVNIAGGFLGADPALVLKGSLGLRVAKDWEIKSEVGGSQIEKVDRLFHDNAISNFATSTFNI